MNNHVITFVGWRRPAYTQRVLEHLRACRGIAKYNVLLFLEPGYPEVEYICRNTDLGAKSTTIEVHKERLGCDNNTEHALCRGFDQSDYVIHVEDDILLSEDALLWFEQMYAFQSDPSVFSVVGYRFETCLPEQYYTYYRHFFFLCWGWATWVDRFVEIRNDWQSYAPKPTNGFSFWDISANLTRGNRVQLVPHLARAQNIGAEHSINNASASLHYQHRQNNFWAGSVPLPNTPVLWTPGIAPPSATTRARGRSNRPGAMPNTSHARGVNDTQQYLHG